MRSILNFIFLILILASAGCNSAQLKTTDIDDGNVITMPYKTLYEHSPEAPETLALFKEARRLLTVSKKKGAVAQLDIVDGYLVKMMGQAPFEKFVAGLTTRTPTKKVEAKTPKKVEAEIPKKDEAETPKKDEAETPKVGLAVLTITKAEFVGSEFVFIFETTTVGKRPAKVTLIVNQPDNTMAYKKESPKNITVDKEFSGEKFKVGFSVQLVYEFADGRQHTSNKVIIK